MDRNLICFATRWGPQFGGINSLNRDLLCAFAGATFRIARCVCVVLYASPDDIRDATGNEVTLISLGLMEQETFPASLEPLAWKALMELLAISHTDNVIWLGHDRITGQIALEAKAVRGGRAAVLNHMSYGSYEAFAENSVTAQAKEIEQRDIFRRADLAIAIGPLLRDALSDMLGINEPPMLIPGLADITVKPSPKTLKGFLSGRLSDDARKIKQAHLGVAGFAAAIRAADTDVGLPDVIKGSNEPRLTLRGVDLEHIAVKGFGDAELELKLFSENYAGRAFPLHALPFTSSREELFEELANSTFAMMPSWHEGFGLVGWESIAAGVPLIVSAKSGVFRLLKEIDDGTLMGLVASIDVAGQSQLPYFQEKDRANLTSAILLIAKDIPSAKTRAARLRESLATRFSWAATARQLSTYFQWDIADSSALTRGAKSGNLVPVAPQPVAELIQLPHSTWQRDSGLSDSLLLRAEEAMVPFDGRREQYLEQQLQWAIDPPIPLGLRLLTGSGGVGKTRLALELSLRLIRDGWHAGFLRSNCDTKQAFEYGQRLADDSRSTLVVIDYAEARPHVLIELLRALVQAKIRGRVRILLLARDGGDWWDLMPMRNKICEPILTGMATSGPFVVPRLYERLEDRQSAYQVALDTFSDRLGTTSPSHIPQLVEPHFGHPLYIHMAAMIALSGERPKSAESLTRSLVAHERRYWRNAFSDVGLDVGVLEEQAALLMAFATLTNGLLTSRDAESVWVWAGGVKPLLTILFKRLRSLYPSPKGLEPWRPDLLGEALIAQVLLSETGSRLLNAILQIGNRGFRQSSLTVLGRLLRNRADILDLVENALSLNFLRCADDILAACVEAPGQFPKIAERAYMRLEAKEKFLVAVQLERQMHFDILPLSGLDVEVSRTLASRLSKARTADVDAQLKFAHALGNLSVALNRNGQIDEALVTAEQELAILKRISKLKPNQFLLDLASSIDRNAGLLAVVGRADAAIAVAIEALEIHRQLARGGASARERDLATSLSNFAAFLSDQGRSAEAFAVSKEGLELALRLYETDQEKFIDGYLTALQNHAGRLEDQGRTEEGLKAAESVLSIRQAQADAFPERYEHNLADALGVYANFLGIVGRAPESITAEEKALEIRKKLASAKPERFAGALAGSYSNLAAICAFANLYQRANEYDMLAISIREDLARLHPIMYESDLASSQSNRGVHLGEQCDFENALDWDERAILIRKRMFEHNPERFALSIAHSYSNFAEHLACTGQWLRAFQEEEECTVLCQIAATTNPLRAMYFRESSKLSAALWNWLATPANLELPEIAADARPFLKDRELDALTFRRNVLFALRTPTEAAIQIAFAVWPNLTPIYKRIFREQYFVLSALADIHNCQESWNLSWRTELTNYYATTGNRKPKWIDECALRAGFDFESSTGGFIQ